MEFYFSLTVKPEKDVEAIDGIRIHTNLLLTAHQWTAGWASPAACQKCRIEAPRPPPPPALGLLSQILNFNKMPRYFLCTFTFEKNCFTELFITAYPKFRNLQTELGKIRWRLKKTRLEYDCN